MAKEMVEEKNLDLVYYLALDGNVKAAMEKLNSIDPAILDPTELETRKKYLARFGKNHIVGVRKNGALKDELISIFQEYWDNVLLQKLTQEEGYHFLFERLTPVVKRLGGVIDKFSEKEYDRVAAFLTKRLKDQGYFAQIGGVSPHLNLMIWRTEKTKTYRVDLGNGHIQKVDVVLMSGFESLGWAAYATFDKLYIGGWVGENLLYCVSSAYDLKSENFKVSFLAHEARHFADKKDFPKLKSVDLEYRAKLNELMLADKSFESLFRKFLLEQKENPNNPHSYASFQIIRNLSKKLSKSISLESVTSVDKKMVQKFSTELLKEHTAKLGQ